MACGRTAGPMCTVRNDVEIDEGTMCLAVSPPPGPVCSLDLYQDAPVVTSYDLPLRAAQNVSISLGAQLSWDSVVRGIYNAGSEAIRTQAQELVRTGQMTVEQAKVWSNGQRNALMQATRDQSSPLGRAIAEAIKPKGKTVADLEKLGKSAAGIIESAGKTNPIVNRVAVGMRYAGPTLLVVGLSFSAYNIATAPPKERWLVTSKEVGTWAGALAGGWAGGEGGAEVGAGIGSFIEPGGGTAAGGVVGAFVGGVGGAIAGGWAGGKAGEYVYRSVESAPDSNPNGGPWSREHVGHNL
jgi:hypothetical protein